MFENKFTDRGVAKFLRLFIGNHNSKITLLGVKMNSEDEGNQFVQIRQQHDNYDFILLPLFVNILHDITTLNILDQLKHTILKQKLLPIVAKSVKDSSVTDCSNNK